MTLNVRRKRQATKCVACTRGRAPSLLKPFLSSIASLHRPCVRDLSSKRLHKSEARIQQVGLTQMSSRMMRKAATSPRSPLRSGRSPAAGVVLRRSGRPLKPCSLNFWPQTSNCCNPEALCPDLVPPRRRRRLWRLLRLQLLQLPQPWWLAPRNPRIRVRLFFPHLGDRLQALSGVSARPGLDAAKTHRTTEAQETYYILEILKCEMIPAVTQPVDGGPLRFLNMAVAVVVGMEAKSEKRRASALALLEVKENL